MIDKATYDDLTSQLECKLNKCSRIKWQVDGYDVRLREAQISDETARDWGTTPTEYFSSIFNQLKIWFAIEIEREELRGSYYVDVDLVKYALNHVGIIKELVAEQIALKLIEDKVV